MTKSISFRAHQWGLFLVTAIYGIHVLCNGISSAKALHETRKDYSNSNSELFVEVTKPLVFQVVIDFTQVIIMLIGLLGFATSHYGTIFLFAFLVNIWTFFELPIISYSVLTWTWNFVDILKFSTISSLAIFSYKMTSLVHSEKYKM